MTARAQILTHMLGKPWVANAKGPEAYDCWHLAVAVSRDLFQRDIPEVPVPDHPTYSGIIRAIADHPEREKWVEVRPDAMGLVNAADGALVLMARRDRPAHVGVWLAPERRVIHADPKYGVVTDGLLDLSTKGWTKLRFYHAIAAV